MDFLAHVEQVEVDFDQIKCLREDREAQISRGPLLVPSHHVKERIRGFWQTLQQRCPRATRVIVSESKARRAGESLPHDLKMMVQMCPVGISASASLLQEVAGCWGQLERSLWRLVRRNASTPGAWEKTNPTWTRQSILLPPKEFRGPVGLYERARYKFRRYSLQKEAARLLLIEALERHHFHGRHEPFDCFNPGCDARFELPGEWTLHAIRSRHDQTAVLPNEVKASFDHYKKKLERMLQQDVYGTWERMRQDWGEEGSEKRLNAEQAFLH